MQDVCITTAPSAFLKFQIVEHIFCATHLGVRCVEVFLAFAAGAFMCEHIRVNIQQQSVC